MLSRQIVKQNMTRYLAKVILTPLILFLSGWAYADTPLITGLRVGHLDDASRLVIETSEPLPISMLLLVEPYRLVVDMPYARWRVADLGASGALNVSPMHGFRFGSPKSDISRLVIELENPAVPEQIFRLPPNDGGHRLVIDLVTRGETAFTVAARALLKNRRSIIVTETPTPRQTGSVPAPKPKPSPPKSAVEKEIIIAGVPIIVAPRPRPKEIIERDRKWRVFIDAGHGGKDPGAIGISGLKEKDVTLKAALELARQFEVSGRVTTILSRVDDRFHRLRRRISLARDSYADVFISLHADAAPSSKARGVSVFTLSDVASDKEAALLASQENKADLIGGPDLDTIDPEITPVLLGIFQRESMNQSSILADNLLKEFHDLPTLRRGHRFAGFAVLKSPDIPSVLIEMGFLTNKKDERNLANAAYRKKLMKRVAKAVLEFLDENQSPLPSSIPQG